MFQELDAIGQAAPDTPQHLTTAPGLAHGLAGTAATHNDHSASTAQNSDNSVENTQFFEQGQRNGAAKMSKRPQGGAGALSVASPVDPSTGKVSLEQLFAGVLVPEETVATPVDDADEDVAARDDVCAEADLEAAEFAALATDTMGDGTGAASVPFIF